MKHERHFDLDMKKEPRHFAVVEFRAASDGEMFAETVREWALRIGLVEMPAVKPRFAGPARLLPLFGNDAMLLDGFYITGVPNSYGQFSLSLILRSYPTTAFKQTWR